MDMYDPIARIRQEIQPEIAASMVEVCLRTLMAVTTAELDQVIGQIEDLTLQRPEPEDALLLLCNLLLQSCRERRLLMQEAIEWAMHQDSHARAIDIEPDSWVVSLKVKERDKRILIRKGWDMIADEFKADITELPERVWDEADGGYLG